jgi:hypothetical protein
MANEQTIQKFYTQVQKRDFARQFQFRVTQLANTNFNSNTLIYLESTNLPGRSITNQTVPFMGLSFNVPGTATYPGSDSWSVTFRCDQNYDVRATLENATFNTFDDGASSGDFNIGRNSSIIQLELLGKKLEVLRQYTLYGAYVVSVGDMSYNLGDAGTIQTVPATLAYQFWRVTKTASSSSPSSVVATPGQTGSFRSISR